MSSAQNNRIPSGIFWGGISLQKLGKVYIENSIIENLGSMQVVPSVLTSTDPTHRLKKVNELIQKVCQSGIYPISTKEIANLIASTMTLFKNTL